MNLYVSGDEETMVKKTFLFFMSLPSIFLTDDNQTLDKIIKYLV